MGVGVDSPLAAVWRLEEGLGGVVYKEAINRTHM